MDAYVKEGDKLIPKKLKGSTPDADGLVKLETTASLSGDINISDVNVAKAKKDSELSSKYSDGGDVDVTVDSDGKSWTANENLATQIINAKDVQTNFTYTAGDLTKITYISSYYRTLHSLPNLRVEEDLTYTTGDLTQIQRNLILS